MTPEQRNKEKAENIAKHARVIEAVRILKNSNKFTREELYQYMHGMMGYVTGGELMDVYEYLGLASYNHGA